MHPTRKLRNSKMRIIGNEAALHTEIRAAAHAGGSTATPTHVFPWHPWGRPALH